MSDLVPHEPEETSLEDTRDRPRCSYCKALLHPAVYFCLGCGTPYKDSSLVVSKPLPPVMDESDLIRAKAPHVWTLFWSYVGVLVFFSMLTMALFQEDRPDLQLIVMEIALLVTTCIWARLYWRTLWAQFQRSGLHPITPIAIALLFPLLAVNYGYHWLFTQVLESAGEEIMDPIAELQEVGFGRIALIITFCLFPAVTEEIAFRGLVQHWLMTAIKPWRALVLASFLFAIMHFSIVSLPYLFAVGMLLGWVKWKTGSLYPAMLIHFLHNFVVIEYF